MKADQLIKYGQLGLSALVVIVIGLVYGIDPASLLPEVFGFEVNNLELKNIFRAIMGLYIAMGTFWIVGLRFPSYWKAATVSNLLFMGGLGLGRLISLVLDGISSQFVVGMLLEFFMMAWGIYNLKKDQKPRQ